MRRVGVARLLASVFWLAFGFMCLQLAYMKTFLRQRAIPKSYADDSGNERSPIQGQNYEEAFLFYRKKNKLKCALNEVFK